MKIKIRPHYSRIVGRRELVEQRRDRGDASERTPRPELRLV
jgi:hypothetical protein